MKFSAADYAQALYQVADESPAEVKTSVARLFSALTASHNRNLLPLIIDQLEEIEAVRQGQTRVTVVTAQPLSEDQRQRLLQQLSQNMQAQKTITLVEEIDETMIGGIKLRFNNKTIDHSIRTHLNHLAEQL